MAEANWHPKREARRFEPPPWERDQFEALRKRDESAEPATPVEAEVVALRDEPEELRVPLKSPTRTASRVTAVPFSEAQVQTMLFQLGAEEPKVDEHLKVVGVFASAVAMFFGLCMFVWGALAFATSRGQIAAVVGSMIVLGMGLVFGIAGLWFGLRVTRGQGD